MSRAPEPQERAWQQESVSQLQDELEVGDVGRDSTFLLWPIADDRYIAITRLSHDRYMTVA